MLGQLTLADIAIMPVIVRLEDVNLTSMWDRHPAVGVWLEAIQAHPAYAKAVLLRLPADREVPAPAKAIERGRMRR